MTHWKKVLRIIKRLNKETGFSYIETLVALSVLGSIAVVFLGGVSMTSKAAYTLDVQETAASLAQLQVEWVKKSDYVYEATQYTISPVPDTEDYIGYSVAVTAQSLNTPDDGIQKISITVSHYAENIIEFETYKVNR
ncbi:hypothetical protein ACFLYQ_01970 [Chloroflexota bacterium]